MELLFLDPGQFQGGLLFRLPRNVTSILSRDQLAEVYNAIPATCPWQPGYRSLHAAQGTAIQQLVRTVKWCVDAILERR